MKITDGRRNQSMTAAEYRSKITRELNLTLIGAARAFGISARQTYRYSRGEGPVPRPLAKLIRLAAAQQLTGDQIERL